MATLDRVIEMQGQGLSEAQISSQLQNEGVSPKEVSDSLNQAKIKNAVSPPEGMTPAQGTQGMQESIMPGTPQEQPSQEPAPGQGAEMPAGQPNPEVYEPQPVQEGQPQDDYYTQTPQAYSGQEYYAPQGSADTETISEIAEQVVTEKLNELKKKTGDVAAFKTAIQDRVADIDDRLKRIEGSIDKLQQAVIGKIGEFGESSTMIHKDLNNLHGTVSKLMNPLVDNYNELKKISK